MQINNPTTAPNYYDQAGNIRSGTRNTRVLLTGEEDSKDNYRLYYGEGVSGSTWSTPRHHHNFEQIRLPLDGDYSIGKNDVLPAGWVGYFPEAAYYGPQVMTENLTMLMLQFGGPSGLGYLSVQQRKQGRDELLAKGGTFEDGIYKWVDEDGRHHNKDAFEACWEQVMGEPVTYPQPRFRDIILMNPEHFGWTEDPSEPGVARRHLGTFTERDIRISFVRLNPGAEVRIGAEPSVEVCYVISGGVRYGTDEYGALTAFSTTSTESAQTLQATEDTKLFLVKLPTF
ncbi:hypothetical protein ACSMXN_05405 [Jatrophihabitans sp. DSM 45814]